MTELVLKHASLIASSHFGVVAGVTFSDSMPGRFCYWVNVLFLVGLEPRAVGNGLFSLRSGDISRLDYLFNYFGGLLESDSVSRLFISYVIILN